MALVFVWWYFKLHCFPCISYALQGLLNGQLLAGSTADLPDSFWELVQSQFNQFLQCKIITYDKITYYSCGLVQYIDILFWSNGFWTSSFNLSQWRSLMAGFFRSWINGIVRLNVSILCFKLSVIDQFLSYRIKIHTTMIINYYKGAHILWFLLLIFRASSTSPEPVGPCHLSSNCRKFHSSSCPRLTPIRWWAPRWTEGGRGLSLVSGWDVTAAGQFWKCSIPS